MGLPTKYARFLYIFNDPCKTIFTKTNKNAPRGGGGGGGGGEPTQIWELLKFFGNWKKQKNKN